MLPPRSPGGSPLRFRSYSGSQSYFSAGGSASRQCRRECNSDGRPRQRRRHMMTVLDRALLLPRNALIMGCAVFVALAASPSAWGQEQSVTVAKDAIFARKILMDTINNNMDELETMTTSGKGIN